MTSDPVHEYVSRNKKWLEGLAISGNRVVRAMALAVLKVGGDSDEVDQNEKK